MMSAALRAYLRPWDVSRITGICWAHHNSQARFFAPEIFHLRNLQSSPDKIFAESKEIERYWYKDFGTFLVPGSRFPMSFLEHLFVDMTY
jgi:hypothetical protein